MNIDIDAQKIRSEWKNTVQIKRELFLSVLLQTRDQIHEVEVCWCFCLLSVPVNGGFTGNDMATLDISSGSSIECVSDLCYCSSPCPSPRPFNGPLLLLSSSLSFVLSVFLYLIWLLPDVATFTLKPCCSVCINMRVYMFICVSVCVCVCMCVCVCVCASVYVCECEREMDIMALLKYVFKQCLCFIATRTTAGNVMYTSEDPWRCHLNMESGLVCSIYHFCCADVLRVMPAKGFATMKFQWTVLHLQVDRNLSFVVHLCLFILLCFFDFFLLFWSCLWARDCSV